MECGDSSPLLKPPIRKRRRVGALQDYLGTSTSRRFAPSISSIELRLTGWICTTGTGSFCSATRGLTWLFFGSAAGSAGFSDFGALVAVGEYPVRSRFLPAPLVSVSSWSV